MMKKVNITIEEDLLKSMDEYAQKNFLTRSGLISLLGTQMLQKAEQRNILISISQCLQKIANTNGITDENLQKLEELQNLYKLVSTNIELEKFRGGF